MQRECIPKNLMRDDASAFNACEYSRCGAICVYYTSWNNTTSVIDIANDTVTATVPVGIMPWGVGVSPDGSKVYVTNNNSNDVSVINTTNNTVTDTVKVGSGPTGVAVNQNGTKVYVANGRTIIPL